MGVLEIRKMLLERGLREYETMAGWRPLVEFDPYGLAPPDPENGLPAGVNWSPRYSQYDGQVICNDGKVQIADVPNPKYGSSNLLLGAFNVR